mgnify:CR=1 FL=1
MNTTVEPKAADANKTLTTVIYALYASSLLLGITCLVAIVMNYVKKDDVAGTYLESHFRWQIRTFWFAVMWIAVSLLMVITRSCSMFCTAMFPLSALSCEGVRSTR